MADRDEAKLFKQYLEDSNTFNPLVRAISSLRKCDPKPDNPLKFIWHKLTPINEVVNADEFRRVKENLNKLNEDMSQLKNDITKISEIISQFMPTTVADECKIVNESHDSGHSMDNNFGDHSPVSDLNETSISYNEPSDTTIKNSTEFNSTMNTDACNDSNAELDNLYKFTMEFVEVDVFQAASQEPSLEENRGIIIAENIHGINSKNTEENVDEKIDQKISESASMMITSTPAIHSKQSLFDIKIHDLPIVMKGDDSEDPSELSQSQSEFFAGFGKPDVITSEAILKQKIDETSASEFKHTENEDETMSQDEVQQLNEVNTADVGVVNEDIEDQLTTPSVEEDCQTANDTTQASLDDVADVTPNEDFDDIAEKSTTCIADTVDDIEVDKIVEDDIEVDKIIQNDDKQDIPLRNDDHRDTPMENDNELDGTKNEPMAPADDIENAETALCEKIDVDDIEVDKRVENDDQQDIPLENNNELHGAKNEPTVPADGTVLTDRNENSIERSLMLNDDPETQLFLSFS